MAPERAPARAQALVGGESATTPWEMARPPRQPRTANTYARDDGARWPPASHAGHHLMDRRRHAHPCGGGDRKACNIAADGRCVIATAARRSHPSISSSRVAPNRSPIMTPFDTSPSSSRTRAGRSSREGTRSRVRRPDRGSVAVHDLPDRPVAGVRPPGMTGMEQFDPGDLPKPTRWDFGGADLNPSGDRGDGQPVAASWPPGPAAAAGSSTTTSVCPGRRSA